MSNLLYGVLDAMQRIKNGIPTIFFLSSVIAIALYYQMRQKKSVEIVRKKNV